MAKKSYGKVMDGLFTPLEGEHDGNNIDKLKQEQPKSGRKPAKDLSEKDKIYRTTIYLTKQEKKLLHDYVFENEITISETIRELIRKHLTMQ